MTTESIRVETTVSASADQAWGAFTTPGDITQWNFASEDWCCPSAEVDLTVGGKYTARMEAKDGSVGFDFGGVYEEVEPGSAITLVLDDGRKSRTTFETQGDGTKVTTVFDAERQHSFEQQCDGWQAILNNFKAYVDASQINHSS